MSRTTRTRRAAFTLVELLVVIAIIGVLIALLLPAIQAAREAARRLGCRSNLKQMATGILSYETSQGAFPPAFRLFDWSNWNRGYTYGVYILPYIEQQQVYDMFTFRNPTTGANCSWNDAINAEAVKQPMTIYQCPSASTGREGVTDYAACDMIKWDSSYIRALVATKQITERGNGVQYADNWKSILMPLVDNAATASSQSGCQYPYYPTDPSKPMKVADVTDGLAQSILLVEDADRPNFWKLGKLSGTCGAEHWADPQSWYWIHSDSYCPNYAMFNCQNSNEVYSLHPGGALFAFGDASVHFFANEMAPEVFVSLFTRSFGDSVKEGDY